MFPYKPSILGIPHFSKPPKIRHVPKYQPDSYHPHIIHTLSIRYPYVIHTWSIRYPFLPFQPWTVFHGQLGVAGSPRCLVWRWQESTGRRWRRCLIFWGRCRLGSKFSGMFDFLIFWFWFFVASFLILFLWFVDWNEMFGSFWILLDILIWRCPEMRVPAVIIHYKPASYWRYPHVWNLPIYLEYWWVFRKDFHICDSHYQGDFQVSGTTPQVPPSAGLTTSAMTPFTMQWRKREWRDLLRLWRGREVWRSTVRGRFIYGGFHSHGGPPKLAG